VSLGVRSRREHLVRFNEVFRGPYRRFLGREVIRLHIRRILIVLREILRSQGSLQILVAEASAVALGAAWEVNVPEMQ
jgi:hypothetical protein